MSEEMDKESVISGEQNYILGTYARPAVVFENGDGVYVRDTDGKEYLDFVSGIGVNALGYGHKAIVETIRRQSAELIHISNLYHSKPQIELAKQLVEKSFADRAFFCNSGAEAMEGSIKFARKWAKTNFNEDKTNIIAFSDGFHGRLMGSLAITARPAYQKPFSPLMPGALFAEFNNLDSVKALIDETVCAVIVEPIQGEGGVNIASIEFINGLRELCSANNALLIFDEIQCGLGRTGKLWAYEQYGIEPDIMTLAKPLAAGLPMGAVLMTEAVASVMKPGDHGTTFGANPLVCATANTAVKLISSIEMLKHITEMGLALNEKLNGLKAKYTQIKAVRGMGLIWGIETEGECGKIVDYCLNEGLLTVKAGPKVLRLLPPYIIEPEHIEKAVSIIDKALGEGYGIA